MEKNRFGLIVRERKTSDAYDSKRPRERLFGMIVIKIMKPRIFCVLACLALSASACSKEEERSGRNPDWERGRAVYVANCVACHNNDPAKDGPIGPALKGSPQALLESRVLRTEYPPGYKPKRDTKVMPTFPFLKTEIPYLAAYLG